MERILLKDIDKPNLIDIAIYIKTGGYSTLEKALQMQPHDIIDEVKKSGLVGRGGAAFPTGLKWEFTRKESEELKYVVCNADEGEPGTFKDRVILKNNPHLLVESMIIAGYAIGAKEGLIYIRGEYFEEIELLKKAIEEAKEKGFIGENILGLGFSYDLRVYPGAGSYVCGEETTLFESLEGKRGCSRERPPFPTHSGFMGKPTAINNVETLCDVPTIIEKGGDWYSKIGSPNAPGTKLFCISGHVNKPGVYEIPMELTLRELIDNYGGGVKGKFKAVLPGGVSSSLLTDLDVKLDYKSVAEAGSMLGSASVIVINGDSSIVDVAKNSMEFFVHESCGQCTPCREGTRTANAIIGRFANGEGREEELEILLELGDVMYDTSRCGLGQAAMNITTSAIKLFREEFMQRVKN
uniref:Ion-translocating oxidoreductase complex subunit C n=1 Tax=Candidatus Methanophaga sp. ANME-1 ERB7 TaxID=2759913 RepID=A0A7G9ZB26_9EURY|nr:ion-translocating oxidoreductase complex subunit C [Methanosarcinales archaeon ANME-1 ERB7]